MYMKVWTQTKGNRSTLDGYFTWKEIERIAGENGVAIPDGGEREQFHPYERISIFVL